MIKCGVDLIYNLKFESLAKDVDFISRVFNNSEARNKEKLKSIFALKEATMKALGKKIDWKDILIEYGPGGKPEILVSKSILPKNFISIDGSVSHDMEYTIAFVIIELK